MSIPKEVKRVTTQVLQEMKSNKEKIAMLTAYDYSMAKILDAAGMDIKRGTKILHSHGATFDVPAWKAFPPRAVPFHVSFFTFG